MPSSIASNSAARRDGSASRSTHAGKTRPSFSNIMANLGALSRAVAAARMLATSSPCRSPIISAFMQTTTHCAPG
eukprot:8102357-Lingulodinium_polyedra.AAC.1